MEKPYILFDKNKEFTRDNLDEMKNEYIVFIFIDPDGEIVKPISGVLRNIFTTNKIEVLNYENTGEYDRSIMYTGRELLEVCRFVVNKSYRFEIDESYRCIGYHNNFLFFMDMKTESPCDVIAVDGSLFDIYTIGKWEG